MREDGSDAPSWAHPKGEGQELREQAIAAAYRTRDRLLEFANSPRCFGHHEYVSVLQAASGWEVFAEELAGDAVPAAGQNLSEPIQDGARTKSPNPEGKKP